MDERLRELADFYGIETSNTPGPKIINPDGTERLARPEDMVEIFGLYCSLEEEMPIIWEGPSVITFNPAKPASKWLTKIDGAVLEHELKVAS